MTLIATLFTISYFSVVDPDEIILDDEDINDPFIHVNIEGHQNIQQGASPYLQWRLVYRADTLKGRTSLSDFQIK